MSHYAVLRYEPRLMMAWTVIFGRGSSQRSWRCSWTMNNLFVVRHLLWKILISKVFLMLKLYVTKKSKAQGLMCNVYLLKIHNSNTRAAKISFQDCLTNIFSSWPEYFWEFRDLVVIYNLHQVIPPIMSSSGNEPAHMYLLKNRFHFNLFSKCYC